MISASVLSAVFFVSATVIWVAAYDSYHPYTDTLATAATPALPATPSKVSSVAPTQTPEPATDDMVPVPASDGGSQVCQDYLFAGRPAPDVSPGFYVERIVCLTPEGYLQPVEHPTDLPGLQALTEALRMELLASQRLAEARLAELNRVVIARKGEMLFSPVVYVEEENP